MPVRCTAQYEILVFSTVHVAARGGPPQKYFDQTIKKKTNPRFLKKNMYYHNSVKSNTNDGKKIIKKLFLSIRKNPNKYINVSKYDKTNIARSICDFIAGMTDRYAINLYKKIK